MPKKSAALSIAERVPALGGVAAVDKALSLLLAFQAGDKALTLSDLSERCVMHKSTCLRLLASLMHAGLMQKTAHGNYALGPTVPRLQGIYMAGFSLGDLVYPALQALVTLTGESAAYSVIQGNGADAQRLCLYRVNSKQLLRDHIHEGELLPINRGAGGRVLMAFANLAGDRVFKVGNKDKALLAKIVTDGYFAAVGDRSPELAGIAAPVFRPDGRLAASLTLTMPSTRYNPVHIPMVVGAAKALSATMPMA